MDNLSHDWMIQFCELFNLLISNMGPCLISSSTKAIFWGVASVIWQPDRKKSFRSIFAIFKTTNLFDYCVIRINITTLSFNSMAIDYSCIIPNLKHTNI